jgi:trans-aconitate methyltransferase
MTAPGATKTGSFSADPAHVRWLGTRILGASRHAPPQRVLDIGCGDGALIAHLAAAWPDAECVGVDLSEQNVRLAMSRVRHDSPRVTIVQADYLNLHAGRFDVVVASSTLQGIDASLDALANKLGADVAAGGWLIHVTPYRCGYNSALNAARSVLRTARSSATDRLILAAAHVLHPREPNEKLRERLAYMYMRLQQYEDDVRVALEQRGFRLITTEPAPHTSLGQPKHRLAVMQAPR